MQQEGPRRAGHCSHDKEKSLAKFAAKAVPTRVPGVVIIETGTVV
jgi:hypothetical protein